MAAAHAAELLSQKEELRSTKEEANRLKDQLQQEKQASAKHAARATELSSAHDGLLLKAKQREVQHLEALERSNDLERQASAREAEALSLRNDLRTKNGLLQKASAGFRQEGDAEKQASATPAVVKPEATGTKKPRGMNECEPAAGGEKNDRRTASQVRWRRFSRGGGSGALRLWGIRSWRPGRRLRHVKPPTVRFALRTARCTTFPSWATPFYPPPPPPYVTRPIPPFIKYNFRKLVLTFLSERVEALSFGWPETPSGCV